MNAKLQEEIREVTNLLSDLIRIDTTSPPGNEIEAAKYLAETLEKEEFNCELFESAPEMGSICYGFHPMCADIPYGETRKTIHGIDERISTENLVFGTSVLYNVVESFMT
ncbi:hypothetical protein KAU92_03925 [Candidatus Bathyarchaeota archaeon]|nr:hypothetical protein [Candidatus Bathyarchaeota archaeon]